MFLSIIRYDTSYSLKQSLWSMLANLSLRSVVDLEKDKTLCFSSTMGHKMKWNYDVCHPQGPRAAWPDPGNKMGQNISRFGLSILKLLSSHLILVGKWLVYPWLLLFYFCFVSFSHLVSLLFSLNRSVVLTRQPL